MFKGWDIVVSMSRSMSWPKSHALASLSIIFRSHVVVFSWWSLRFEEIKFTWIQRDHNQPTDCLTKTLIPRNLC